MSNQEDKKRKHKQDRANFRVQEWRKQSNAIVKRWIAEQNMPIIDGIRIDLKGICTELWARPGKEFKRHTKEMILDMLKLAEFPDEKCSYVQEGEICTSKGNNCIMEQGAKAYLCDKHTMIYREAMANQHGNN